MNRISSWLALAAALIGSVSSCCTIRTTCDGPGRSGAPCGPTAPAIQPAPAQNLFAIQPQGTPNPFYVALGQDGRCQDLPSGQGVWRGRELFTLPGKTF